MTDILYNKTHESVYEENGIYVVGVGYPLIKRLGKVIALKLPKVGECFAKGEIFGWIESENAAAELYIPLAGRIVEVNEQLLSNPESFNRNEYESMRLFSVASDSFHLDKEDLLSKDEYLKSL